ncbi:hypothetical protein, partial [Salmonella enterica]|uniref:hypothetical protein n=1 Tax=Salmonella enterica TaxID=28901 RepID=UPI001C4BEDC7
GCLSISPPPQRIFFAIRQEVHLSVAASVISPLTGLGCFAVLLLTEYCCPGNKFRFHYQAHPLMGFVMATSLLLPLAYAGALLSSRLLPCP